MAYFQVMALCVIISVFALWRTNVLLAIVSSAGWFAMLAYHLSNPPSNVTSGSTIDTFIVLAMVGVALVIPIMALQRQKIRNYSGKSDSQQESTNKENKTLSSMNPEEYRSYLKTRMRNRK